MPSHILLMVLKGKTNTVTKHVYVFYDSISYNSTDERSKSRFLARQPEIRFLAGQPVLRQSQAVLD